MSKTLMINFPNMLVGGIEDYIYKLMNLAVAEGYRVIWLADVHYQIAPIYKSFFDKDKVEIIKCNTHGKHWFTHEPVKITSDEDVTAIAFGFMYHVRNLELLSKINCKSKYPVYAVPHFTGGLIFIDQKFKLFKPFVRRIAYMGYQKFLAAGQMLFMANSHFRALDEAYALKMSEEHKTRLPVISIMRDFDIERIIRNYHRDEFVIVAASRFEFPHKGFMLGLIDDFCMLKAKYPQLKLIIVGDGDNRDRLYQKVEEVPEAIRSSITVHEMMPMERLLDLYEECNLSISVAGCASAGARIGLLTLPARHYTNDCEVYGFMPESRDKVTSVEPGMPVGPFIEEALNMSEEEYIERSKATYDDYERASVKVVDIIAHKKQYSDYYPSSLQLFLFKTVLYLDKLNSHLKCL